MRIGKRRVLLEKVIVYLGALGKKINRRNQNKCAFKLLIDSVLNLSGDSNNLLNWSF